jgi:hypothetical protein
MKALTVKQPWASAIIFDGKNVENRSRPTKHRGQLYIHAGKSWDKSAVEFIARIARKAYMAADHGMVIGTVDVIGCHHADDCTHNTGSARCSEWAMPDHYHWVLANPMPVEIPFPAKGKLGLWNLEDQP